MITAAFILALLALTVLLSGTGWSDVLSADRNELVFAGRNQAYGAYRIRQEHHRTMLIALVTGLGFVGAVALLPMLFRSSAPPVFSAPEVGIDVVFDPVMDAGTKPKELPAVAPKPKSPEPQRGEGALVAVDSMAHAPVDTAATSHGTDPTPDGGATGTDPGPDTRGGGGGGDDGGTDGSNGVRNGWELESMPEYPGGSRALYAYLRSAVRYPDIDIDARREGRVTVGFIIRSDGSVADVKVLEGISPTMDAEAVRVVRKMAKWIPGKFNKREVDVRYALPIVFKLQK
ncbi:MAG: TonB family protein [Flavobacteriales bacterium]|nr:TonB family protein [Flavobacteriales bacterium]